MDDDSRPSGADDLAGVLRGFRTSRGLTQKELAAAAGISPSYVGLIETGDRQPAPDVLERVAQVLDIDESDRRTLLGSHVTPTSKDHGRNRQAGQTLPRAPMTERILVHTLVRAEVTNLARDAVEASAGPIVLAVRCPSGHANPTYLSSCRVCGLRIKDSDPVPIHRPSLGRLVLSDGQTVELIRGVILGRLPDNTYDDLMELPTLVKLIEAPEISRNHVQVTINGWEVFVRDLGSVNGSWLTPRGGRRVALPPKQFFVLSAGAKVCLADSMSFSYEAGE